MFLVYSTVPCQFSPSQPRLIPIQATQHPVQLMLRLRWIKSNQLVPRPYQLLQLLTIFILQQLFSPSPLQPQIWLLPLISKLVTVLILSKSLTSQILKDQRYLIWSNRFVNVFTRLVIHLFSLSKLVNTI